MCLGLLRIAVDILITSEEKESVEHRTSKINSAGCG